MSARGTYPTSSSAISSYFCQRVISLRTWLFCLASTNSLSLTFNILAKLGAITHLMSVAEVAIILGCSEEKIYRMAARHKIPNVLIGGARCFDPSTLIVWLTKKEPQLAVAARH